MADNVTLNAGTGGPTISADDIDGVKVQRVKIQYGEDGKAFDVHHLSGLPVTPSHSSQDAFFRFRVSNPQTVFDSKMLHDKLPDFWDEAVTGGASANFVGSKPAVEMAVVANSSVIRQTLQRMNYSPGKSQEIIMTFKMSAGGTGVIDRVGLFDQNNGVFFEKDNSTVKVVVRNSTNDISVSQSNWNLDKLNGTGKSGKTLDATKAQLILIDYEWLGIGTVRFAFIIDGDLIYCHETHHTNSFLAPYMQTPNLPLRYEISSAVGGAAATMDQYCSTVMSEGGAGVNGITKYLSNGATQVDANVSGTLYAAVGVKLKTTHLDKVVRFQNISVFGTANFEWLLIASPVVAGTFTYNDTQDGTQVAFGATANTVTGGTPIAGGYAEKNGQGFLNVNMPFWLGSTIAGAPNSCVLCVRPLANNADIFTGITLIEMT